MRTHLISVYQITSLIADARCDSCTLPATETSLCELWTVRGTTLHCPKCAEASDMTQVQMRRLNSSSGPSAD